MRKRLFIIIPLLLLFLFLLLRFLAAGEFAPGTSLDRWRVENREEAREALLREEPRALVLRAGGRVVSLPPSALRVDIRKTLRQIPPATLWQKISGTGGRTYPVRWTFSRQQLRQLWKKSLLAERGPRPPSWQWRAGRWQIRPGRAGLQINKDELWRSTLAAARLGGGEVQAKTTRTRPQRSTGDLRRQSPTQLLLDQSEYTLFVYRQGRLLRTYPVAVGAPDSPTPNGDWKILERAEDPAWLPPDWAGEQAGILVPGGSPDNPIVSRWMGIGDGVGIHGTRDTASLGSAASKGCVRMDPNEVVELYRIVPRGTPFVIRS